MKRLPPAAVLWIIPAVYFVFVASEFAAMTTLALGATADGRSALAVGLLSTALWGGILLGSSRSHAFVERFGHARVFVGATLLSLVSLATMPLHGAYPGWLAGAFVLGLGGGLVWVSGEAWLAESAPPDRRGFFVGLFETSVGLGLMAGPALVPLTRWLGVPTLWGSVVGMVLALAASALLLRVAAKPAHGAEPVTGSGKLATAGPPIWRRVAVPLAALAAVSGLMESGVSALLPSISMRLGYSVDAAAWLGTCIGAGSALLQPPAGHLADRWNVRGATLLAWAVVLAATVLLWATAADPGVWLWLVGFALGGMGGAVYTLLIVELGHRLAGPALVKAISVLVVAYASGTAVGPALGGALFDSAGLRGLASALLAVAVLGTAVTLQVLRSAAAGAEQHHRAA